MWVISPFSVDALVAGSLKGDAVGPVDPGAGKRMRMVVVPAVNCLPGDVPPDLRGLLEALIDGRAEIRRPETRLCRRVTDHGNAISDDSSSERAAVCCPVFSGQRGQKLESNAARMCLGQGSVVVSRYGHDGSGNTNGGSNAVDLPY